LKPDLRPKWQSIACISAVAEFPKEVREVAAERLIISSGAMVLATEFNPGEGRCGLPSPAEAVCWRKRGTL